VENGCSLKKGGTCQQVARSGAEAGLRDGCRQKTSPLVNERSDERVPTRQTESVPCDDEGTKRKGARWARTAKFRNTQIKPFAPV